MAKITMIVGFVLVALGFTYWGATGRVSVTALIPAFFGIALMIAGARARTENTKTRMLFMHVAVTIGLLGFLFPGVRGVMGLMKGLTFMGSKVVQEELVMAIICLVFTGMCVRSFIAARRTPASGAAV